MWWMRVSKLMSAEEMESSYASVAKTANEHGLRPLDLEVKHFRQAAQSQMQSHGVDDTYVEGLGMHVSVKVVYSQSDERWVMFCQCPTAAHYHLTIAFPWLSQVAQVRHL